MSMPSGNLSRRASAVQLKKSLGAVSHAWLACSLLAAAAVSAKADFMLSDFESGAGMNALYGYWYHFGDAGGEGNSKITTMDSVTGYWDTSSVGEGYGGSVYSGRMGWVFGDKRPTCGTGCTYDPEVNMATDLRSGDTVQNLTGATAVSFAAKANAPVKVSFMILLASIKDHAHYRQVIEVTREWKVFTVNLQGNNLFTQPTWGIRVPFSPSQVTHFQWQVSKGNNAALASDSLLVDDVKILGWTPPDPTSILKAGKAAAPGTAGKAVSLGFGNRLTVSLADAPSDRGGLVRLQDVAGRLLCQRTYRAGQAEVEIPLKSGLQGLALVRILPAR